MTKQSKLLAEQGFSNKDYLTNPKYDTKSAHDFARKLSPIKKIITWNKYNRQKMI